MRRSRSNLPNRRTQISLHYGSKYVLDRIDARDYKGYTDVANSEIRYDINKDWDIGAHASLLNSWSSAVQKYGVGASVGYKVMYNSWLSVGYNLLGFDDNDFNGAEYRSKGAYATIRVKFDQDTLKLNSKKNSASSLAVE